MRFKNNNPLFHITYHSLKIDVASVNIIKNNMRSLNKREYKTLHLYPMINRTSI